MIKNKLGKGLVSMFLIIILLVSVLAGSFYYENNITAYAVNENTIVSNQIQQKEVNDVKGLNQLNEGWYKVIKGNVFYLEHFDSLVSLHIVIKNPEQQNGIFVVDAEGNVEFEGNADKLVDNLNQNNANQITGEVTGLEGVSGMQAATPSTIVIPFQAPEVFKSTNRAWYLNDDALFRWNPSLNGGKGGYEVNVVGMGISQNFLPLEKAIATYNSPSSAVNKEIVDKAKELLNAEKKLIEKYYTTASTSTSTSTSTTTTTGATSTTTGSTSTTTSTSTSTSAPPQSAALPAGGIRASSASGQAQAGSSDYVWFQDKDNNWINAPKDYYDLRFSLDKSSIKEGHYSNPPNNVNKYVKIYQHEGPRTLNYQVSLLDYYKVDQSITSTPVGQMSTSSAGAGNTPAQKTSPETPPPKKGESTQSQSAQAPPKQAPNRDSIKISDGVVKASDGEWYYKEGESLIQVIVKGGQNYEYKPVTYRFDVSYKDSAGKTFTVSLDATSPTDAQNKLKETRPFVTEVKASKSQEVTVQPSSTPEIVEDKSNNRWIVNYGKQTIEFNDKPSAEKFADELNQKAKVESAFQSYLKQLGRTDGKGTDADKKNFYEHLPPELKDTDKNLVASQLNIPVVKPAEPGKETVPYTIDLLPENNPDGKYKFTYQGKPYYSNDKNVVPDDLKKIMKFNEDIVKKGTLQKGLKLDKEDVYYLNGKYYTLSNPGGADSIKAVATEKIGGTEYSVTYTLQKGKQTVSSFKLNENGEDIPLTTAEFNALKSNAKQGDIIETDSKGLTLSRTSSKTEGKIDSADSKIISTKSSITIAADGSITSKATTTIENNKHEIISKVVEDTFSDKSKRVTALKGDTDEIDKITFITSDGKSVELDQQTLAKMSDNSLWNGLTPEKQLSLYKAAAEQGFKSLEVNKDGNLVYKDKTIQKIGDNFVFQDGSKVVREVSDSQDIKYSGNVKIIQGRVDMGEGATKSVYENNKLVGTTKQIDSGRSITSTLNNDGTYTIQDTKSTNSAPLNSVHQVQDINNQFFRMYEFKTNGGTYYLDGNTVYKEVGGKKVEVDKSTVSSEVREALGIGIDEIRKSQGKPTRSQESSQRFFFIVEAIFTEFRGLGYYASLFMSEDSLLKWREDVDKVFAKLYLGTEYWTSEICSSKIKDSAQEGIAFAETPQGLAQIGAHIEATRSNPAATGNATEFIYKITFNVRNGDYEKDLRAPEEMKINVILLGQRSVTLFKQDQVIKRGSSFGKSGKDAIVKASNTLYSQVCIRFDKIPAKWKIKDKELCNNIQASSEEPAIIKTASSTSSAKPSAGDMNDI